MARIFLRKDEGRGTIKALEVFNEIEADLCTRLVSHEIEARTDFEWAYVDASYRGFTELMWVDSSAHKPDIKICFVQWHFSTKWVRPHPLQGKL